MATSSELLVCSMLPWENIFWVATIRVPVPSMRPEGSVEFCDEDAPGWRTVW